jgi:hypothetical protein
MLYKDVIDRNLNRTDFGASATKATCIREMIGIFEA